MTVSFDGIKVGDRVRVFNSETQDEATFVVVSGYGTERNSSNNSFYADDWTSVKVLPPLPKPLPTEPGFYQAPAQATTQGYHLGTDGTWHIIHMDGSTAVRHHDEIRNTPLVRLVVES